MMTLIYRIILAGIVALIGWDLFTEKKLTLQLNAAMVLIPLVLLTALSILAGMFPNGLVAFLQALASTLM